MPTRLEAPVVYLHTEVYRWPQGRNPNPKDNGDSENSNQHDTSPDPEDCDVWALKTKQFITSARGLTSASLAGHTPGGRNSKRTTASGKLDQRTAAASARERKKRVRFDIPDPPQDSEEVEETQPSATALNLTREPTGYEFDFPHGQYGDGNKLFLIWPTSPGQQQSPTPWFAAVSCLYRGLHRNVWAGDWETEAPSQPVVDSSFENHKVYYEWKEILAGLGLAFSFWSLRGLDLSIRKQLRNLVKANRDNPDHVPTVTAIRSALDDVQLRVDDILENLDAEYDAELETYEDIITEVWEWTPEGEDLVCHLMTLYKAIREGIKNAKGMLSLVHRAREMISSIESIKAERHHHAVSRGIDGASIPKLDGGPYSVHPSILKAALEGTSLIEGAIREFIEAEERRAARIAELQEVDEQCCIASSDQSAHSQDPEGVEEDLLANKCRGWVAHLSQEIKGICDVYESYGRAVKEADSVLARMVEGEFNESGSET